MSGNLWMFSDKLDDEDIEILKHEFITYYQGADYYGLGLKVFTRLAHEAGAVYKIGKKVLIRRTIFDEKVRKAKKTTAQKAYHNTEVLLEQYRTITWILDCVPEDLSTELHIPQNNLEALASRIDIEMSLENKRLQNQLTSAMKTKMLVDRVHDALGVLRKKPENGEELYKLIYNQYIDPVRRKSDELVDMMHVSSRTYYRMRSEAISVLSIRLWSAPSSYIDDWLEILTIMENL